MQRMLVITDTFFPHPIVDVATKNGWKVAPSEFQKKLSPSVLKKSRRRRFQQSRNLDLDLDKLILVVNGLRELIKVQFYCKHEMKLIIYGVKDDELKRFNLVASDEQIYISARKTSSNKRKRIEKLFELIESQPFIRFPCEIIPSNSFPKAKSGPKPKLEGQKRKLRFNQQHDAIADSIESMSWKFTQDYPYLKNETEAKTFIYDLRFGKKKFVCPVCQNHIYSKHSKGRRCSNTEKPCERTITNPVARTYLDRANFKTTYSKLLKGLYTLVNAQDMTVNALSKVFEKDCHNIFTKKYLPALKSYHQEQGQVIKVDHELLKKISYHHGKLDSKQLRDFAHHYIFQESQKRIGPKKTFENLLKIMLQPIPS